MSIIIPGILNTGQITTVSIDDNAVTQAKLAHDIDVSHLINDAGYKSDLTSFTTDNLTEGSTNLYWTEARFDTSFGNKNTGDLTEGSNLYYTDARVQTWFGTVGIGLLSTDAVAEGSNLYFTDARAVSAIEGAELSAVEVNPDSFNPSTWTAIGGADIWGFAPLRVSRDNGTAFAIARRNDSNGFGYMESIILERDYDFSGVSIGNDTMSTHTTFIATPGGGARRTSSIYTKLRDITVAGTDGTDCEYDVYNTHYELVVFDKTSGNNENSTTVFDASADKTSIANTLEVVNRSVGSGSSTNDSSIQLRYVGTVSDKPEAYISLKDSNAGTTTDMVRFRDDLGTYKTEFEQITGFNNQVHIVGTLNAYSTATFSGTTNIGNMSFSGDTISSAGEVEFDSDFNVTGTTYFGHGSGTGISSSGQIQTFGSATSVPFGNTIKLNSKTADPTGEAGMMYFNTTTNKFRGYNGTAWVDLG